MAHGKYHLGLLQNLPVDELYNPGSLLKKVIIFIFKILQSFLLGFGYVLSDIVPTSKFQPKAERMMRREA